MSSIVFIQNKDSRSWAVKDNLTGDLKGLITEHSYSALNGKSYSDYSFCYFDDQFEMYLRSADDLSEAQAFFSKQALLAGC
jgi:hypothetical protein